MSSESVQSIDNYTQPAFSTRNKIKRLFWNITWLVLCRWTPNPLHKWRILILRSFGARIGNNCFVYPDCKVWAPWLLEMGAVATIGPRVEVYNPGGVFLGNHCILSQEAYICGATHDYNSRLFTYISRKITIDSYAWICAKAIVLPGVHCGEGSVLAAAAVASRNLDAWGVYAGNPAVKVKDRNNFLKD